MVDSTLRNQLDALLNEDNTAIELYRGDFATPVDIDSLRFWCQREFDRIQSGFSSTDEVIRLLARIADLTLDNDSGESGGESGGESEGFTPSIFSGAGTTGYVPDPGAENNYALSDKGVWRQATKVFFQLSQPNDIESTQGDLWLVST